MGKRKIEQGKEGTAETLEDQFRRLVETVGAEIGRRGLEASQLILEAEKLAEENGVPFRTHVSPVKQCYVPSLFHERFEKLDLAVVAEITDLYEEDVRDGWYWQYSEIC